MQEKLENFLSAPDPQLGKTYFEVGLDFIRNFSEMSKNNLRNIWAGIHIKGQLIMPLPLMRG